MMKCNNKPIFSSLSSLLFIILVSILFAPNYTHNSDTSDVIAKNFYRILQTELNFTTLQHNDTIDQPSQSNMMQRLHLIRVPKASSTALSTIARRLVGCDPPGPCCHYPGDPVGSCPDKRLFQCEALGKVIGCTHHRPFIKTMVQQPDIPTITMLRHPIDRSISGFNFRGSY